jgi:hypothetical protein
MAPRVRGDPMEGSERGSTPSHRKQVLANKS